MTTTDTSNSSSVASEEFVRRFLLHILPKGLMRGRHYGFLANRCRRQRLVQIRRALAVVEQAPDVDTAASDAEPAHTCPYCRQPTLWMVATHLRSTA